MGLSPWSTCSHTHLKILENCSFIPFSDAGPSSFHKSCVLGLNIFLRGPSLGVPLCPPFPESPVASLYRAASGWGPFTPQRPWGVPVPGDTADPNNHIPAHIRASRTLLGPLSDGCRGHL